VKEKNIINKNKKPLKTVKGGYTREGMPHQGEG